MKSSAFVKSLMTFFVLASCSPRVSHYLTEQSAQIHEQYWSSDTHLYDHFMKETDYETPVYVFHGEAEGPAVLIIGGTHGNEPAGFEAAHRLLHDLVKNPINSGTIYLIPESNRIAVINGNRRSPVPDSVDHERGNLNRCYPGVEDGYPMERMAFQIRQLVESKSIDILIDMHESPVFHLEYRSDKKEYHGLGQTIIYTPNEAATWLGMLAIDHLNSNIPPGIKQFSLAERPVKHSAAWMAGAVFDIPGFTLETCKKLPIEERIGYQLDIVRVILEHEGII
jgi:hypothetical protein